ncbi:MAG: LysR family transcriptional regulator [Thalassobaculum sp.]|uniref:LysR family transcriptional regulator n=1 Tax=Thalassobaculum sp. TaxID=2022740 RepID=UPI0032EB43CD
MDNRRSLDLNLLRAFVLIMRERSITRAARRLSIGQPALSHALARLRAEVGDELFVRAGRRMEPTALALALALFEAVAPALDRIDGSVAAMRAFDPTTAERIFSVGMSEDLQLAFLPAIVSALAERMPNARLAVRHADYLGAADLLDRGDVSMVVGYLDRLPAAAKVRRIATVGYRVVGDAGGGAVETLEQYCARRHVLVTFAGDMVGYIDETLARLGVGRRIALSLASFAVLPAVLRGSGCLATVPDYLADALAGRAGLCAGALPFESPDFDISIAWRLTADGDPAERLLRDLIVEVTGGRAAADA